MTPDELRPQLWRAMRRELVMLDGYPRSDARIVRHTNMDVAELAPRERDAVLALLGGGLAQLGDVAATVPWKGAETPGKRVLLTEDGLLVLGMTPAGRVGVA